MKTIIAATLIAATILATGPPVHAEGAPDVAVTIDCQHLTINVTNINATDFVSIVTDGAPPYYQSGPTTITFDGPVDVYGVKVVSNDGTVLLPEVDHHGPVCTQPVRGDGSAGAPPIIPTASASADILPAAPKIEEDQPGWDCATMGNKVCGPVVPAATPGSFVQRLLLVRGIS